jgi:hypothetical protein
MMKDFPITRLWSESRLRRFAQTHALKDAKAAVADAWAA